MRRLPPAWIVAALGAALYLLLEPRSADLIAQLYRAEILREDGAWLWDSGWFAGHQLPAYSVLYPPLGALLGARVVGALAVVAASFAFERLAVWHRGDDGRPAALWFALGATAMLWTGRITFLLGAAIGLAAVMALTRDRRVLTGVLAALSALASPVAGLFVAVAAAAWGLAERRWVAGAAIAGAALAPVLVLNVLFGEGGTFPFAPSAFWPALAACALVGALLPGEERTIRIGVVLYAVLLALAFVLPTAVGGNATRLGALVAGPVLALGLFGRRRPWVLAVAALPLLWWSLYPPVADWVRGRDDPALHASFHAPLNRFLDSQGGGPFRVEVVPTADKGEALYVAREHPIARGWERQLDREDGSLFYEDTLDQIDYLAWLNERAVRFVALPNAPIDPASEPEAELLRNPPPWLREVWRTNDWRVFAVPRRHGLVVGARFVNADQDSVTFRADRAGPVAVLVRQSRWWRIKQGDACIEEPPDTDVVTVVDVKTPGTIRMRAALTGDRCD
ncbi:MAG: hypothetical protein JHC95_06505 [Solirubrobacteraceae bacterium]|nr:hypothetical protein [Solirubrobacteraceae bacterium]